MVLVTGHPPPPVIGEIAPWVGLAAGWNSSQSDIPEPVCTHNPPREALTPFAPVPPGSRMAGLS